MSEDPEDYIVEPTQEQIDKITALLIEASEPQRERLQMEYDGINGITPESLIPAHYRNDFIRIRNRLLDDRGYTHDALMVWIDRYREHFLLDTEMDEGFPLVREYPNGQPIDRLCFMDEIGLLAWLRWCVFDIDKATAKEQLDVGFSVADVSDKGHATQSDMSNKSKDFVFKIVQGVWDEQVEDGKSIYTVPVMARKMLKKLNEEAMGNDGIYFIPTDSVMPRWINQAIKDGKLTKPKG